MELIRTIREKRLASKQQDIEERALYTIGIDDFDNDLYISYNGVPLVPIEKDWTTKEIIEKLNLIRQNYVNAMIKGHTFGSYKQ